MSPLGQNFLKNTLVKRLRAEVTIVFGTIVVTAVLYFSSLFLFPNSALADEVYLKNGDLLTGEILSSEDEHLIVLAIRMTMLSPADAAGFYEVHKGKPFFEDLINFTASGPIVVMVLEGLDAVNRWRNLMGATNSAEAAKGTIRGDFGDHNVIRHNVVHGSDSAENAETEINYFFK